MPKFHLNAHNVWENYSNLIKLTFFDSSPQDLLNDILFDWFLGRLHFPLFLVMTSLWHHFLSHDFKICVFCGTYQVLQRDYKHTMMTSLWHHFIFLGLEIFIFCETGHNLSSCQVSNPSVIWINFTEVAIRHPKKHHDAIMTSLHTIWFSKLYILWKLIEAISLPNFIGLGCLNQILRGLVENTPPPPRLTCSQKDQSL